MSAETPPRIIKQHLIDPEVCIRCNSCEEACPIDAITHDDNNYVVDVDICQTCMACVPVCPTGAIDNWLQVLATEAHSLADQFSWDELPPEQEFPADAVVVPGHLRNEPVSDEAVAASTQAQTEAVSDDADRLENQPNTAAGSNLPPWSAAHPYTSLYTHKNVVTATVAGNYRLDDAGTDNAIHHIVLSFGELPFPVLEGQSIAIFPPGTDAKGRKYHARQYSIASPRDGERPGFNNLSLTVKRVTHDYDGNPFLGVCSNYLCDLKKGDEVQVIGPYGDTFLMPNLPESNLIMICTGTGSAPMRAMTERCRRLTKNKAFSGKLMLFFGARTQKELPYFGPLMNLPKNFIDVNLALSREANQPKRYVQDLLLERGDDVLALLGDSKTCIYVCGLKGMETGVIEALKDIVEAAGQDWSDLHNQLKLQGRLHFETY